MLRDDRETSHYVGEVLHGISPHLALSYRGGAINSHLERAYLNRDIKYSRVGGSSGLGAYNGSSS